MRKTSIRRKEKKELSTVNGYQYCVDKIVEKGREK
jgi:hypothetical protein